MKEFATLGLSQPLVDAIEELGFVNPTPIQSKAIPRLLEDETDFVGLAQTGTGKTAAFGLPLVDLVEEAESHTQALVLAPTRELCLQIAQELAQFGKHRRKLKIQAVYGGTDIGRQIRQLKRGAHIIVATPGRLLDLIGRKAVDIRSIQYVVLDEADEMLNMGFKPEIDKILQDTPDDKLTWLFSATMPDEVKRISRTYMSDPLELSVGKQNSANKDIEHRYVFVRYSDRYEALKRFLDYETKVFGLVFCRTRRETKDLADRLSRDGYNADALHGDLNQTQRDRVMERFRSRRIKILIATDVAARGIDVQDITHVFHFNIPEDINFYTHRSGRTGRAGNKGVSLIFAHSGDLPVIRRLERKIQTSFSSVKIPSGKEVCEKQLLNYFQKIRETETSEEVEGFLPMITEELEALSKEDLIRQIASLRFRKRLKKHFHAPDISSKARSRTSNGVHYDKRRRERDRFAKNQAVFINLGTMDLADKSGFLSFVCKQCQISGQVIGRISMKEKHTFFDVDEKYVSRVVRSLNNYSFKGRSLRANAEGRRRG